MLSDEAYPAAEAAAQCTFDLDPDSAESHLSIGLVKLFYHWDLVGARDAAEHAIALSPGSADVRFLAGTCYLALGQFEQLLEQAQIAASLDPLSLPRSYGFRRCRTVTIATR